jgi:hypothetical protein
MNLMLTLDPQPAKQSIVYEDKLMLMGSCFSDHIGAKLLEAKFQALYNPTGIVYDPISLAQHLSVIINGKSFESSDLFQHNELWHSWLFHSDFSSTNQEETLNRINEAIVSAASQLKSATYLFMTLGSAYAYVLKDKQVPVANCHKAPKEWFDKILLGVEEMVSALQKSIRELKAINPKIQIVFTVSPVKHIRDGIVENNRSKARLIELAHTLSEQEINCSYFPAFELVTDVLRDYRFYATDMAHPNVQAVDFVFDFFCQTYFTKQTQQLMQEVLQIVSAKNHRPLHANTKAHQQFLKTFLEKTEVMKTKFPKLDWTEEERYFNEASVK